MRILFLRRGTGVWDPQGIQYLSATLKQGGHEVRLFNDADPALMDRIAEWKPHVLAYSVTTGFHKHYLLLNKAIKNELPELRPISVFGGPHATFFPEMIETEGVDAVCRGEGELAFLDLIDRIAAGRDYTATDNFWVKTTKGIVRNDVRSFIEDLDSLPLPDRELIYSIDPFLRDLAPKTFFTSRGCPYRCTYCFNHAMRKLYKGKGKYIRTVSVDYVMRDIQACVDRYPVRFARFFSDVFNIFPDWFEEFCRQYKSRFNVPFMVNLRANLVDRKVGEMLADAGCKWAFLGMESGNDVVRNDLLHRDMDRETIRKAVRALQDSGVAVVTQSMIGLPGETFEEAMDTLRLTAECAPDYAWTSIYNPYPRTELGEYAVEKGFFDGDFNKIDYTFYSRSVLKFPRPRDKERIENLRKLLAISAHFKFLIPLVPALSVMPFPTAYQAMQQVWWGYRQSGLTTISEGWKDYIWAAQRFIMHTLGKE
ncbi:MAG TPA: radical SAM protein [Candidatus Brocadiia bacterium]|nr:radical SAM protein [Candidatus Brocadiia bacterium]